MPCTTTDGWISMAASGVGASKTKAQRRRSSVTTSAGWMSGTLGLTAGEVDGEGEDMRGHRVLLTLTQNFVSSVKKMGALRKRN